MPYYLQNCARESLIGCLSASSITTEGPGSREYRDFVVNSLSIFPSLPEVARSTEDFVVFTEQLLVDKNLKATARFINCFFVHFPTEYISQQV